MVEGIFYSIIQANVIFIGWRVDQLFFYQKHSRQKGRSLAGSLKCKKSVFNKIINGRFFLGLPAKKMILPTWEWRSCLVSILCSGGFLIKLLLLLLMRLLLSKIPISDPKKLPKQNLLLFSHFLNFSPLMSFLLLALPFCPTPITFLIVF